MTQDVKTMLSDLQHAREALYLASRGLETGEPEGRDMFTWGLGFALGRLRKVQAAAFANDPAEEARLAHHREAAQRAPWSGADAYGRKA